MKAFMVRHQKAGVLTDHVFSHQPTGGQIELIKAEADRKHGAGWVRVHEADMLAPKDLPSFPKPVAASISSDAGAAEFKIEATGTVSPPKTSK